MADVCISYARADLDRVRRLRDIIARHFTVWWDNDITAGDYRRHIEQQLKNARCVVPVWSSASRESRHVVDEVDMAIEAGTPVLPVRIEPVAPPLGFGRLHMIDLVAWLGDEENEEIQSLLFRLGRLTPREQTVRHDRIRFGVKEVASPCMVFSVSSHETQIPPQLAVQALSIWRPSAVLISAYDIAHSTDQPALLASVEQCAENGSIVLLDSGNYEAYRKADDRWTAAQFQEVLGLTQCDGAFMFDNTRPPADWETAVADIGQGYARDRQHTSASLLPILHAPLSPEGAPLVEYLPRMAAAVAQEVDPPMIAIPERELGNGLIARAQTVHAVRAALDSTGPYLPLHLLGTGNHVTAAVLAVAGADGFDGLEWCRTVADDQTGGLYHFQHYDLVAWQSKTSTVKLLREVAADTSIPYAVRVAFHNLEFFDRWMADLRSALWADRADRFLTARIPGGLRSIEELAAHVPEVFS